MNTMRATRHTPIEPAIARAAARRRRGFTLIELLVVISVISILAAILYPAIKTAIRSSHIQTTKMTVTQVCMAIELFKEMRGEYPAGVSGEPIAPLLVAELGTLLKIKETSFLRVSEKTIQDPLSTSNPPKTVTITHEVLDSWARPLVYTRYVKGAANLTPGSDNGEGGVQPIKNPRTYDLFSCGSYADLVGLNPRNASALANNGLAYTHDGEPLTGQRAGEFNNYVGNW